MPSNRREVLRWLAGAVASGGGAAFAADPARLPAIWPEGALSQQDLEALYRLFSDLALRAPTRRQAESLALAERIYQLLQAWRPEPPAEEEFRRVSQAGLAHLAEIEGDYPVYRLTLDEPGGAGDGAHDRSPGQTSATWPRVRLARGVPRPAVVIGQTPDGQSRYQIVELRTTEPVAELLLDPPGMAPFRVPVEVVEPARLRGRALDPERNGPWPGRVLVEDSQGIVRHGRAYAEIATVSEKPVVFRPAWRKLPCFYCDGTFEIDLPPGPTRITLERGFEHARAQQLVDLAPGEVREIELESARFIDMRARGWISGDTHVHWVTNSWDENEDLELLRVVQRAEDVRVVNNLTLSQWRPERPFVKPDHGPMGPVRALCDDDYHVQMGEEFRNDNHFGHVNLLNLRELVWPISTGPGSGGDAAALDYPLNRTILETARAQGAVCCEAHNLGPFGTSGVPVNVVHGLSDCLDQLEPEHYYRFLDCGFHVGLGNGSDHPARVLGCCRVYVWVEPPWSYAGWVEGLRRGRTFTTSGPLLELTVAGAGIGERIAAQPGQRVRVEARAWSRDPLGTFEVVSNGRVLVGVTTANRQAELVAEVELDGSRWFVARSSPTGNYDALSGPGIAHTSAIYGEVAGRPVFRRAAAEWWLANIAQHRERVARLANFASDAQRQEALAYIDQGTARYRALIDQFGGDSG